LRPGDLVVEAGGRPVTSVDDLHTALDALSDGESLALGLVRGAEELSVSVTFGPSRQEGSV
ncbi:MAG TPA: PDZ domain-containing protein, partial [Acidimicrobiales bacterium]|nr:PDZ domain-containing protein [Acidimicrobiales bacterium]